MKMTDEELARCRDAFEESIKSLLPDRRISLECHHGKYSDFFTECLWLGYQAAWSAAHEQRVDDRVIGCLIHDSWKDGREKHENVIAVYDAIRPYLRKYHVPLVSTDELLAIRNLIAISAAEKKFTFEPPHNFRAKTPAQKALELIDAALYPTPPEQHSKGGGE